MTNNNNNKGYCIPKQFKLNVPETATVAYYYPEEEVTIVPLIQDGSYLSEKVNAKEVSYGPCSGRGRDSIKFKLEITLKNRAGSWKKMTVNDVDTAVSEASKITASEGFWEGSLSSGSFSTSTRKNLAKKINDKIDEHVKGDGKIVIAAIVNDTIADD